MDSEFYPRKRRPKKQLRRGRSRRRMSMTSGTKTCRRCHKKVRGGLIGIQRHHRKHHGLRRRKRKLRRGSAAWLKRQNRNAFRRAASYSRIIGTAKRKSANRARRAAVRRIRRRVSHYKGPKRRKGSVGVRFPRGVMSANHPAVRYMLGYKDDSFVAPELKPHYQAMKRGEKY